MVRKEGEEGQRDRLVANNRRKTKGNDRYEAEKYVWHFRQDGGIIR